MPTLNWIGKEKVINHDLEVPYHVLDKKYTFNANDSENMIIHGDNLLALKSLLPKYEGRINCIYIDPPYNTGEEGWIYNDNVNDPHIKEWLGKVVGNDSEDMSRHDKWLCMMYPRLKLLYKLLSNDGIIFISIDDNEYSNLKLIMDEIFGRSGFCATYFWKRTETPPSLSYKVRKKLEYVICYQKKNIQKRIFSQGFVDGGDAPLLNSGNPIGKLLFKTGTVRFNIPDGCYSSSNDKKVELLNNVIVKDGLNANDFYASGNFKWGQEYLDNEINKGGYILVKTNKFSMRYQKGEKGLKIPSNIIDSEVNVDTNETAKKELKELGITDEISFDYAKPVSLIKYLIKMAFYDKKDILILDSFAGSGTTGHAVLQLNKEDGGNRKFIEIELMDYAEKITANRLKLLNDGYSSHDPIHADFSFYELGEELFVNDCINRNVDADVIREYIYYSSAKEPIDRTQKYNNSYMLGIKENTSYYFFYEKDKECVLNYDFLSTIDIKTDAYIIYADACTLSKEELANYHISFKKIPRDIAKF